MTSSENTSSQERTPDDYPNFTVGWVPVSPSPVKSGNENHLVYEIQFTSYCPHEQEIRSIEVRADDEHGPILSRYEGEALAGNILKPGNRNLTPGDVKEKGDPESSEKLPSGGSLLVYFFVSVPAAQKMPTCLYHRVDLSSETSVGETIRSTLNLTVEVKSAETVVIAPPLKEGLWGAVNGLSNTTGQPPHGQAHGRAN